MSSDQPYHAPWTTKLDKSEIQWAIRIAKHRKRTAKRLEIKDSCGIHAPGADLIGATAEIAAGKLLGLQVKEHGGWHQGDLEGTKIEVRGRRKAWGELCVRPWDHLERPFVLILHTGQFHFLAKGWSYGWRGIRIEWSKPRGNKIVYYMPHKYLFPMETLPGGPWPKAPGPHEWRSP